MLSCIYQKVYSGVEKTIPPGAVRHLKGGWGGGVVEYPLRQFLQNLNKALVQCKIRETDTGGYGLGEE